MKFIRITISRRLENAGFLDAHAICGLVAGPLVVLTAKASTRFRVRTSHAHEGGTRIGTILPIKGKAIESATAGDLDRRTGLHIDGLFSFWAHDGQKRLRYWLGFRY